MGLNTILTPSLLVDNIETETMICQIYGMKRWSLYFITSPVWTLYNMNIVIISHSHVPYSQIARLQAELEQSHASNISKDHQLTQAQEQVTYLTRERDTLFHTTEMYEVDKRELQDEVCVCVCVCWKNNVPNSLSLSPPQLSQLRHRAQQKEEEKDQIRKTMTGFVSQEKEKLAKHMKYQQKDLLTKNAQIEQVPSQNFIGHVVFI